MTKTVSYEVHAFVENKWIIDSVYDDREMALFVARDLLKSPRNKGVQVVEEIYDNATGSAISSVLMNRRRRDQYVGGSTQRTNGSASTPGASANSAPALSRKKSRRSTFVNNLIVLILAVGGIGLAFIAIMYFFLEIKT